MPAQIADSTPSKPLRIGVILGNLGNLRVPVLKYLILHLNTLQSTFEFEILAAPSENCLGVLLEDSNAVDRGKVRSVTSKFHQEMQDHIVASQSEYGLADTTSPTSLVVITMARFQDNYYSLREGSVQIIALGNWKRYMAPPSVYEFLITLLMRQSVGFACPTLSKSVHWGTKGCLFDFTQGLYDVRYKALQGFICSSCRENMENDGFPGTPEDLITVLEMKWFGNLDDPQSPAAIAAKLGHNLFLTQGIKPTVWESVRSQLRDEGTKELVKFIFAIILLATLIWLGLKKPS